MVVLHNVIDIRNGAHYSIVRIKENKARFFIPAPSEEEPEEENASSD